MLHGVTLGSTGSMPGDRHPKIGNWVLIGCNATVLGNIYVGNSVKIGSGAVVLKDIPSGCTAVGNPARIICKGKKSAQGQECSEKMATPGYKYYL